MTTAEQTAQTDPSTAECDARSRDRSIVVALLAVLLLASAITSQQRIAVAGDSPAQLASPVSLTWSDVTLRDGLRRLGEAHHIACLLDRRIDPDQKIDVVASGLPLAELLENVAHRAGCNYTHLEGVAYFGPPNAVRKLHTIAALLRDQLAALPQSTARAWRRRSDWAWHDLAEPRTLADQLAAASGIKVVGGEQIPHDLWAAASLPALDLPARWSLLLVQFDLRLEIDHDGSRAAIVTLPDELWIERRYPAGRDPQQALARLRAKLPEATVRLVDGHVVVRGRWEDHQPVSNPSLSRRPRAAAEERRQVHRLRVQDAPLRKVLKGLAAQLDLSLEIDEDAIAAAGLSLEVRVSFEVSDASLDELLAAALNPAGLRHQREGREVQIVPDDDS